MFRTCRLSSGLHAASDCSYFHARIPMARKGRVGHIHLTAAGDRRVAGQLIGSIRWTAEVEFRERATRGLMQAISGSRQPPRGVAL